MNPFVILLIGVAVSLLSWLIPRRKRVGRGWLVDSYGVLGALVGGWLGEVFDLYQGTSLRGYFMSGAFAGLFIVIHRTFARRRASVRALGRPSEK
jgi:uncharacterized membrane protein YeaQ/YmgE (transglycosylase-associated protein family)